LDKFDVSSEFIEESKKLGQTMPKRNGGRYTKYEQTKRRDEVYRLHFDYGYSARKIAEMMNVNKNTINSDVDYWYSKILDKTDIMNPEDGIISSIERLNLQRNRLREALDKTISFEERLKLERLILESENKIGQMYLRISNSLTHVGNSVVQAIIDIRNSKEPRLMPLFNIFSVTEKASKEIDDIRKRDLKERRRL
jgi:hypothetical protein